MRFTIEVPNELFPLNISASPPDVAAPLHYAATDALSGGAAPPESGDATLFPMQGALSAGSAEALAAPASPSGVEAIARDGGSAPR
jgi:hypothetical protein